MNKKTIIILVIAVLLILIGWFLYTDLNRNVCWPYCEGMTDQDREDIKKSALEAETKDWKTYKNEKYEFELTFPTTWGQIIVEENSDGIWFNSDKNQKGSIFYIDPMTNQQWNDCQESAKTGIPFCAMNFLAKNSTMIFNWAPAFQDPSPSQEERMMEVKDILSSFKFTNPLITGTSDWKTFKDEGYGFEIKYPQEWTMYGQFGFGKKGQGSGYDGELFVHVLNQPLTEVIKALELKEENRAGDSVIKETKITINGISATYILVTNDYLNKSVPSWEWHNILIEKNGVTYSISNGAVKSELFEEFYQSFKFTN